MSKLNDRITTISRLQQASSDVFCEVAQALKAGMSEFEIANLLRSGFAKRGIVKFWYDVPIIVLIGVDRLIHGANADYETKSPSKDIVLEAGDTIYVDSHPQDTLSELWGDWNTMAVFQPRTGIDDEQVAFLKQMREIHRVGISQIQPSWTGADLMDYYFRAYEKAGITPLLGEKPDIGHTIHAGPKAQSTRLFLNTSNMTPLAGHFYAIEPAGFRQSQQRDGQLMARFEECIYVPKTGKATLLGSKQLVPVVL